MERMMYNGNNVAGMYLNPVLVKINNDCEATCEHMTHHLLMGNDMPMKASMMSLLYDCSDICGMTAKYVARGSYFAKDLAGLCEDVCTQCGNECSRFDDPMSQHCALVCYNCARNCGEFARS